MQSKQKNKSDSKQDFIHKHKKFIKRIYNVDPW